MSSTGQKFSFEDLSVCYRTGRSYFIRKEGRHNITGFKEGIQTKAGAFEVPVWKQMVRELIEQSGEQELQNQLLIWEREHTYFYRTEEELEMHTLELHARRIFDNREWISYIPFNQRFRPEVLAEATLIWIETVCCQKPGQVTKEQLDMAVRRGHSIFCPYCGRCTEYRVCGSEEQT